MYNMISAVAGLPARNTGNTHPLTPMAVLASAWLTLRTLMHPTPLETLHLRPTHCNPQKIAYTYPLLSETPRQAEQPQTQMSHPVTSDRVLDATLLTSRPESSIHPTDLLYSWTHVLNRNYQLPIYADHTTLTSSSSDARIDNRDYAPTNGNGNQPQGVMASSTPKAVCYATADASQSST